MSGRYIVMFKNWATPAQIQQYIDEVNNSGGQVTHEYSIIKAFAGVIPDHFLQTLRLDSIIESIEQDSLVTTQG
ncbi:hypothetical protein BDN72DRAFT_846510 [Pluteus cervinus]|uniref:Uncharacterized protein n=1 Tax=Pluteus cervinus TaxID=181527 RepID=A0ACD3AFY1_9AGAR|nr:hypothetical protein BDN72DRAFT_846510 [Pluteus cervinus]